jgi:hypothetical protein
MERRGGMWENLLGKCVHAFCGGWEAQVRLTATKDPGMLVVWLRSSLNASEREPGVTTVSLSSEDERLRTGSNHVSPGDQRLGSLMFWNLRPVEGPSSRRARGKNSLLPFYSVLVPANWMMLTHIEGRSSQLCLQTDITLYSGNTLTDTSRNHDLPILLVFLNPVDLTPKN